MIFIHHDSVVVLTTRHTATSWVLAMFPNSTVTGGDVSTLLAVFVSARKERKKERKKRVRFVSRSQKRRREKKENDIEIGARKARERVPTPIKPRASRETKPPSRVKTSKRRFQTSRRNAFPQHLRFRRQVPGLFPILRRKKEIHARAFLSSSGQRDRRSLSLARSSNEEKNDDDDDDE